VPETCFFVSCLDWTIVLVPNNHLYSRPVDSSEGKPSSGPYIPEEADS
jgi:hypothetical protein